jgi:hypothetical protein
MTIENVKKFKQKKNKKLLEDILDKEHIFGKLLNIQLLSSQEWQKQWKNMLSNKFYSVLNKKNQKKT